MAWDDVDFGRYLVLAGAVVNLMFGLYWLCRSLYRQEKWKPADGRIVDVKRERTGIADAVGRWSYFPVVTFRTRAGTEHSFKSSWGTSQRHYVVGYSVKVLHDPANPDRAMLDDGFTLCGGAAIGLGIGAVFGLIAWMVW